MDKGEVRSPAMKVLQWRPLGQRINLPSFKMTLGKVAKTLDLKNEDVGFFGGFTMRWEREREEEERTLSRARLGRRSEGPKASFECTVY